MSEKTGISWCDATFNPWWGCIRVSEGCTHCYAETFSKRMGLNIWGPGQRRFFGDKHWNEPLKWNADAKKTGTQRRVFCASMADVFEALPELTEQQLRLWKLIEQTPALEWLLLTKRPENIDQMIPNRWKENLPDNVRLGVTAEDQANADKRIPELLRVWKGKNFISYEPAIGSLCFGDVPGLNKIGCGPGIDWVICGGESGAGCRSMELSWARSVRYQCERAGVPFFMKQLGGFPDKRHNPAQWPEDLRIQEFPLEAMK